MRILANNANDNRCVHLTFPMECCQLECEVVQIPMSKISGTHHKTSTRRAPLQYCSNRVVVVPLCIIIIIIFIVFTSHCCSILVPAGSPRPQLSLHVGGGSSRPELRAAKGHGHRAADPLPAPVAHPARPVAALGPLQHPVGLLHHPSVTAGSQPDQSQSGDN